MSARKYEAVDALKAGGDMRGSEMLADILAIMGIDTGTKLRVANQAAQQGGEHPRIVAFGHEAHPAVFEELRQATHGACNHWQTVRHGLEHRERESFAMGREQIRVRRPVGFVFRGSFDVS